MDKPDIDTRNEFLVGAQGDHIVVMRAAATNRMTREQTLRYAATLVAVADLDDAFPAILDAVRNA